MRNRPAVAAVAPNVRGALLAALCALGFVLYWPGLHNDFVWDDRRLILGNPNLESPGRLAASIFSSDYFDLSGERYYRPLITLSYSANLKLARMFGPARPAPPDPFAFHLTNLLVHLAVSVLVWRVLTLLSKREWESWTAAVLFVCHPVHSEPVDFIAARVDTVAAFFYFLCIYCRLRALLAPGSRSGVWRAAALVSFAMGLLSKEMAITVPAALVLLEGTLLSPSARPMGWRKWTAHYSPYFAMAALYLLFRYVFVRNEIFRLPYQGNSFSVHMATMARAGFTYWRLLFLPVHRCTDYFSYPLAWNPAAPAVWAAVLGHAVLAGVAALSLRRFPWAACAALFFYVSMAPVSNVVPILTFVSERFLYIPSFSVCLLFLPAASALFGLSRHWEWSDRGAAVRSAALAALVIAPVAAASLALLYREHRVWRNERTLFADQTRCSPASAGAFMKYGMALSEAGDLKGSERQFESAVSLAPDDASTWKNLGTVRAGRGDYPGAASAFERSARLDSGDFDARFFLAAALARSGRTDEAREALRAARERNPDHERLNALRAACAEGGSPICGILDSEE